MKSKLLAISAISAAFSAIILTIGSYIPSADFFCVVTASAFVLLPLYYNSFLAGFLSFLAGGVIAFIFSGFNFVVVTVPAFLLFFGSFPLAKFYAEGKGIKKWITYLVGLVWCVGAVFGIYFFYLNVSGMEFIRLPQFVSDNILIFVAIAGVLVYVIYERYVVFLKRFIDYHLKKFIK